MATCGAVSYSVTAVQFLPRTPRQSCRGPRLNSLPLVDLGELLQQLQAGSPMGWAACPPPHWEWSWPVALRQEGLAAY